MTVVATDFSAAQGGPISVTPTDVVSDPNGDPLTFSANGAATGPGCGSVSVVSGSVTVTPSVAGGVCNVPVEVTDMVERKPLTLTFTSFRAAPAVSGLSPTSGDPAGGAVVTIAGSGFTDATAVTFGGNAAAFTVLSDASVRATAPAGVGTVDVQVTTGVGSSDTSGTTDNFTYVDTTAPLAPVVGSPSDGALLNTRTPVVSGTAEAGATVEVFLGTVSQGTTVADGSGAWSFTFAGPLAEQAWALTARARDAAGNVGPLSTAVNFTIDATAPAAPGVTAPASGATTSLRPTFSGSAEAGATVTVRIDGSALGTTTATGGAWSFTPSADLAAGARTLTVTATDAAGNVSAASAGVSFTAEGLGLSPASLSSGQVGQAFTASFSGTGGTGPYSFAVTGGALPAGLTLSSGGDLGGTPTAGGAFSFTVTVTDTASSQTAHRAYSLTISAPTLAIAPAGLAAGTVGVAYSESLTATGGTSPYLWAVSSGALPAGLTLDGASGALAGTPTTAGSYNFSIRATDSSTGSGPFDAVRAYSLTINAGAPQAQTLSFTSAAPGDARAGGPCYTPTATATSGLTVVFTLDASSTGCTLSSGVVSFTGAGTCRINANQAGDAAWAAASQVQQSFAVSADTTAPLAPVVGSPSDGALLNTRTPVVSGTAEAGATVEVFLGTVSQGTTVADGSGAWSFTFAGPLAEQAWALTARARDAAGNVGPLSTAVNFTIDATAPAAPGVTAPASGATTSLRPTFSGSAEAGATVTVRIDGSALGTTTATGGAWSFTPSADLAAGARTLTVTATDAAGNVSAASAGVSFTAEGLGLSPASLSSGQVGQAFTASFSGTGGTGPYSFAVTGGALPAGLTLSSGGDLGGTPTAGGAFSFTVTVTDTASSQTAHRAYSLTINAAAPQAQTVSFTSTAPGDARAGGASYTPTATATSGLTVVFTLDASSTGCTLSSGVVSFTGAGTCRINANQAGDAAWAAATQIQQSFAVSAAAPPPPPPPPAAGNVEITVPYNATEAAIPLAASGSFTSLSIATAPTQGTVSITGSTAFYTPRRDFIGSDSFTYVAIGPEGASAPGRVSILVPRPAAPQVPAPPPALTPEAGAREVVVTLVTPPDGTIDRFDVVSQPLGGEARIEPVSSTLGTASVGGQAGLAASAGRRFQLVYLPREDFLGEDRIDITASGPGGVSAPATYVFRVTGVAPDLVARTAPASALRVRPTAGLTGGPFQGLRITEGAAFGTATVEGLDIVFTTSAADAGTTSLTYVIDLPFGASAAGTLRLTSELTPHDAPLRVVTQAGRPVTVDLTTGARGGPFVTAAVGRVAPVDAGVVRIVPGGAADGRTFVLEFTPSGQFTGEARIGFSLDNGLVTGVGEVQVTVAPRPDPTVDADVGGVVTSQVDTARRFADAQIDNFSRRLLDIRTGANRSRSDVRIEPGFARPRLRTAGLASLFNDEAARTFSGQGDPERDTLGLPISSVLAERSALAASEEVGLQGAASDSAPASRLGVWATGSLDWGRRDAVTGERDFRITSRGLTAGLDVALRPDLVVGAGVGYGRDRTEIGSRGSESRARTGAAALYGGWQPTEGVFVDGLVGHMALSFEAERVSPSGERYVGSREGDVTFAALTAGLSRHRGAFSGSAYARLAGQLYALDAYTEQGGADALRFHALEFDSLSSTLGVLGNWSRSFREARLAARLQLEWRREFADMTRQTLRYADWLDSPLYGLPLDSVGANLWSGALGLEWSSPSGYAVGLGYRVRVDSRSLNDGVEVRVQRQF